MWPRIGEEGFPKKFGAVAPMEGVVDEGGLQ